MKRVTGEINDGKIIVKNKKDIGRLYDKSYLGEKVNNKRLNLTLIEGLFLLSKNKIKVLNEKNTEITFNSLLKKAAKYINRLETKYLTFKDLRERGALVRIEKKHKKIDFFLPKENSGNKKDCFIVTIPERKKIKIDAIKRLANKARKNDADLWLAIIDEESDITYYKVEEVDITGSVSEASPKKIKGFLVENSILIFDTTKAKKLHKEEFFGKTLRNGIKISLIEALYLMKRDTLTIKDIKDNKEISLKKIKKIGGRKQSDINIRMKIFNDLKKCGLIVKTGFKFGVDFRVYTKKPDKTHAEYLIKVIGKKSDFSFPEAAGFVRLAQSVNKKMIFAKNRKNNITYLQLDRIKP